ncbi:hypothetical protein BvCmsKKP001_05035 [Escherichia coli]|nr:hypothetical protein BvCmsKKP001_05035 [Escherichia coli]
MRGDRRGIRETRGHRVFPGQKAIPASVGQRVSVVRQAHRGYRGRGVKTAPWDRKERRVFRGLLVLRAREVKPEPEAKKESREIPEDLRDQKVTLAPEGSRGLRARQVREDQPEREGRKDCRVWQGREAIQVRLVHRALPAPEDHKGKKGIKVTPARQALPVSGGRKVIPGRRVPQGRMAQIHRRTECVSARKQKSPPVQSFSPLFMAVRRGKMQPLMAL